jgi:excisionase family DNA binding protein
VQETQLLKTIEFAKPLRVHPATVTRWCEKGMIKHVKLGNTIRIPKSELIRVLAGAEHD